VSSSTDCQGSLQRLLRGCQPRLVGDPRHPGSPPVPGGQVAPEEDQAAPEIGSQALPGRCQTSKIGRFCNFFHYERAKLGRFFIFFCYEISKRGCFFIFFIMKPVS
jgi:hypothetical protein